MLPLASAERRLQALALSTPQHPPAAQGHKLWPPSLLAAEHPQIPALGAELTGTPLAAPGSLLTLAGSGAGAGGLSSIRHGAGGWGTTRSIQPSISAPSEDRAPSADLPSRSSASFLLPPPAW